MSIPEHYHDNIDIALVVLLNFIMAIQMAGSVCVFCRTVYLIVKKKRQKTEIYPVVQSEVRACVSLKEDEKYTAE